VTNETTTPEPDPHRVTEWTPATSRPGEILTPMGEVDAIGAAARGLRHRDPRGKGYRRTMVRHALTAVGVGVALVLLIELVDAVR
jgi:hypothetical protein